MNKASRGHVLSDRSLLQPRTITFPGPSVPVHYCATDREQYGSRHEAKARLVRALLAHAESWGHSAASAAVRDQDWLRFGEITADRFGRPILLLGGCPGPSISFSHLSARTWAALSFGGYRIGIDAAETSEFKGAYPFGRAFHRDELDSMSRKMGVECAAAILWSAKESAVKALGCAFHLVDPLDLRVSVAEHAGSRITATVTVADKALARLPAEVTQLVVSHCIATHGVWISISLVGLKRHPGEVNEAYANLPDQPRPRRGLTREV